MLQALIDGLGAAWTSIATFVPKLVGFLVILLIGWLIAKGISKAVEMLLTRTGFPRLIERSGLGGVMSRANFDATTLIVKLVYYFILLMALQLALTPFGSSNPVSQLLNQVVAFLPRIAVAIVLVVVAAAVGKVVSDLIRTALGNRAYAGLLGTVAQVFLVALGIIAALNQMDIATTVTTPVLIFILATVGGILVVGIGGGMVKPMQQRTDGWLSRMESELKSRPAASATPPMPAGPQNGMPENGTYAYAGGEQRTERLPGNDQGGSVR
ncbi:mechanosensitive ion channel family protein [Fodinicola acaciae]|uniref:mechanosensitive ion channel family protein n=1 Tax=Fodinicola acaciae TaxID=2681555 RepID=UPI0013D82F38|nr:hypothetical protein [Fodinicola acaciae]